MEHINDEPITFKRVQFRLKSLIDAISVNVDSPRLFDDASTKELLKNVRDDLKEVRAAVAVLERESTVKTGNRG